MSVFASPDTYGGVGSVVQAAIASSVGTFTSVWTTVDGYGYGVTSKEIVDFGGIGVEINGDGNSASGTRDRLNRDDVEVSIDALVRPRSLILS